MSRKLATNSVATARLLRHTDGGNALHSGGGFSVAKRGTNTVSVEVYIWTPSIHNFNIGHAAIKVTGGMPPGDVYLSAWPKTQLGKILGPMVRQKYADDIAAEDGKLPTTFRFYSLDETAIKAKIDQLVRENTYAILTDNCCSHVRDGLNAGVNWALATTLTLSSGGLVSNPFQLTAYCRQLSLLERHR
ncbi:MAG TPA: hypothetical protein VKV39_04970 [Candidatus Sulfotelmatobacter sp.]|nr:hypothetical protein [Candidatus Sulfotelmatobacter sp.]